MQSSVFFSPKMLPHRNPLFRIFRNYVLMTISALAALPKKRILAKKYIPWSKNHESNPD